MRMAKPSSAANRTVGAMLTADPALEQQMRSIFGTSSAIELRCAAGIAASADVLDIDGVTVVIVDLDTTVPEETAALERMMLRIGVSPPVVVVTQGFDAE